MPLRIRSVVPCGVLAAMAVLKGPETAMAEPCQVVRLTAADANEDDQFGSAVDVDGGYAVIGAPFGEKDGTADTGTVYIYRREGLHWNPVAQIVAPDAQPSSEFGAAVAIDGDVIVVGAPRFAGSTGTSVDMGAAYVFRRDPGTESWPFEAQVETTITSTVSGDLYGTSVAIDGDRIVVGAPGDSVQGIPTGSAHVFRYDGLTWDNETHLVAKVTDLNDEFGAAVAIDGERVLVGAPRHSRPIQEIVEYAGAAYTFVRTETGWAQEAKLTAGTPAQDAGFGFAVAIHGMAAVIGAPRDRSGDGASGPSAGAAYVFRRAETGWSEEDKIYRDDPTLLERFGESVAIRGDRLAIGVPLWRATFVSPPVGAIYVFERNGEDWRTQYWPLSATNSSMLDRLGTSVGLSPGYVLGGVPLDDTDNRDDGATYVFAVGTDRDCNANGEPDDCDLLSDAGLDCNGNDALDVCEQDLGGDANGDQLITLADYTSFVDCLGGPENQPQPPTCADLCLPAFDDDNDGDVDLHDAAAFSAAFAP